MASTTSLKEYIPALARLTGGTPAALYERQRALVRTGLLDLGTGRGPGSGIRATAPAIALLLVSVLATDRLNEVEVRAKAIAGSQAKNGRCPLTGATYFSDAIAALLAATSKVAAVIDITVSRTSDRARIRYYSSHGNEKVSEFVGAEVNDSSISVSASLAPAALKSISDDVQSMLLAGLAEQDEGTI